MKTQTGQPAPSLMSFDEFEAWYLKNVCKISYLLTDRPYIPTPGNEDLFKPATETDIAMAKRNAAAAYQAYLNTGILPTAPEAAGSQPPQPETTPSTKLAILQEYRKLIDADIQRIVNTLLPIYCTATGDEEDVAAAELSASLLNFDLITGTFDANGELRIGYLLSIQTSWNALREIQDEFINKDIAAHEILNILSGIKTEQNLLHNQALRSSVSLLNNHIKELLRMVVLSDYN